MGWGPRFPAGHVAPAKDLAANTPSKGEEAPTGVINGTDPGSPRSINKVAQECGDDDHAVAPGGAQAQAHRAKGRHCKTCKA